MNVSSDFLSSPAALNWPQIYRPYPKARWLRLLGVLFLVFRISLFGTQDLRANGESSPYGVAAPFRPHDVVRSAGSYNALTGSVTRSVTDLVVPGAVGAYPLAFGRSTTSRYVAGEDDGSAPVVNTGPFGPCGSWRHNYRWGFAKASSTPLVWRVAYPDGGVVLFAKVTNLVDPATNTVLPAGSQDPYFRSQTPGIADRLENIANSKDYVLHRHDGGTVYFQLQGTNYFAISITDPFGQTTGLTYYTSGDSASTTPWDPSFVGRLKQVTEPAGRYLLINWNVYNGQPIIKTVTASNGQSVTYNYGTQSSSGNPSQNAYTSLTGVTYNSDIDPATNAPCQAIYTYTSDNTGAGQRPLLLSCDDPHFTGPLPRIKYSYVQSASATYGQIQSEIDAATGTTMSTYAQSTGTNTRGDGPSQTFNYPSGGYLLSSVTDFENNSTGFGYDANGFENSVTNRNNHTATVQHEPYAGKRLSVSTTDGGTGTLTTTFNYGGTQSNPYVLNPYYLMSKTTPQGLTTTYTRDTSHQVKRIDYPSGAYELLYYNGFGQVYSHRLANGNTLTYDFDSRGMLYDSTDGFNNTSQYTHYYYDGLDRLKQVTDFKGHSTYFTYNGRHLLTQIKHDDNSHIDYTYDKYGNRLTVSDELQHVTTTTYDNHRRPRTISVPVDGAHNVYRTTTFTYERGSASGDTHTQRAVATITLATGKQTVNTYSANGRLKDTTVGYGTSDAAKTAYLYYPAGNLKQVTDPLNHVTSFTYDPLERRSTATDPLGHVTHWNFYGVGNGMSTAKLGNIQYPDGTTTAYYNYEYSGQAQTI